MKKIVLGVAIASLAAAAQAQSQVSTAEAETSKTEINTTVGVSFQSNHDKVRDQDLDNDPFHQDVFVTSLGMNSTSLFNTMSSYGLSLTPSASIDYFDAEERTSAAGGKSSSSDGLKNANVGVNLTGTYEATNNLEIGHVTSVDYERDYQYRYRSNKWHRRNNNNLKTTIGAFANIKATSFWTIENSANFAIQDFTDPRFPERGFQQQNGEVRADLAQAGKEYDRSIIDVRVNNHFEMGENAALDLFVAYIETDYDEFPAFQDGALTARTNRLRLVEQGTVGTVVSAQNDIYNSSLGYTYSIFNDQGGDNTEDGVIHVLKFSNGLGNEQVGMNAGISYEAWKYDNYEVNDERYLVYDVGVTLKGAGMNLPMDTTLSYQLDLARFNWNEKNENEIIALNMAFKI